MSSGLDVDDGVARKVDQLAEAFLRQVSGHPGIADVGTDPSAPREYVIRDRIEGRRHLVNGQVIMVRSLPKELGTL